MPRVVIGLGSNLGDRLRNLRSAVEHLVEGPTPPLTNARFSPIFESAALLRAGAPKEWDLPFYNAALSADTALEPELLLAELKSVEERIGRQYRGEWSPREIDLDILVWGDKVIESDKLTIPHKELLQRDFALVPLAEVEPDFIWPVGPHKGKKAIELIRLMGMEGQNNIVRVRHHSLHPQQ